MSPATDAGCSGSGTQARIPFDRLIYCGPLAFTHNNKRGGIRAICNDVVLRHDQNCLRRETEEKSKKEKSTSVTRIQHSALDSRCVQCPGTV